MNAITLGQLLSIAGSGDANGATGQAGVGEQPGDALLAALFATALSQVMQEGGKTPPLEGTDAPDAALGSTQVGEPVPGEAGAPLRSDLAKDLPRWLLDVGVSQEVVSRLQTRFSLGETPMKEGHGAGQLSLGITAPARPDALHGDPTKGVPLSDTSAASAALAEPDPQLLQPDFRARLERVIQRMASEFGHTVRIVEGYRTPERQNALFEQGRTQPGDVVTWTRASRHMDGLAADVIVDGTYDDPAPYRRLAQIAEQEGLKTLPGDAGHLEWRGRAGRARQGAQLPLAASEGEALAGPGGVARPARVADVAEVARVARTAPIGSVAEGELKDVRGAEGRRMRPALGRTDLDGRGRLIDGRPVRATGDSRPTEASEGLVRGGGPEGRGESSGAPRGGPEDVPGLEDVGSRSREQPVPVRAAERGDGVPLAERRVDGRSVSAAPVEATSGGAPNATAGVEPAGPVSATQGMERVQQIQEIQDARPAGALQQITLRMDDADGEAGLMRVRLDGGRIDASMGVRDLQHAGRLQSQMGELQQSLRLQGLEPGSLQAQALGSMLDPASAVESVAQRAATRWWTGGESGGDGRQAFQESRGQRDPDGSPTDARDDTGSRDGRPRGGRK